MIKEFQQFWNTHSDFAALSPAGKWNYFRDHRSHFIPQLHPSSQQCAAEAITYLMQWFLSARPTEEGTLHYSSLFLVDQCDLQ